MSVLASNVLVRVDDVELKGFAKPDSVYALVPEDDPGLAKFEAGRKALDQQMLCEGLAHLKGVDRGMLQQAAKIVAARHRTSLDQAARPGIAVVNQALRP